MYQIRICQDNLVQYYMYVMSSVQNHHIVMA